MRRTVASRYVLIAAVIAATSLIGVTSSFAAGICEVYPTRCQLYDNDTPRVHPRQQVPAMRGVMRGALDAIPPHMRRELYPDSVRDAVRSGNVDRGIERYIQRNVDPSLNAINGYGRGGSGYTNDAAIGIRNGTLDPATVACQAMGGCR